jgi:inner membrane protein
LPQITSGNRRKPFTFSITKRNGNFTDQIKLFYAEYGGIHEKFILFSPKFQGEILNKQTKEANMNTSKNESLLKLIKDSIVVRVFLIGFLIIILLIPSAMVMVLIEEREQRRNSVIHEINSKWALWQTLTGPVLGIPYKVFHTKEFYEDKVLKKTVSEEIKTAYFLPDRLNIRGSIFPETRYRGIYQSVVYTADLEVSGEFLFPDFESWNIPDEHVMWDGAILSFGISEMRGINKNIQLNWGKDQLNPKPGVKNKKIYTNGISTRVVINKDEKNTFSMKLNLRGSEKINFYPLGRLTEVDLKSKWSSPSFEGAFLPKTRVINKDGFLAHWEIFDYNRDYPQYWQEDAWDIANSKFGLELIRPIDEYQKTSRSSKYSILFIALTFLAFFLLFELINKRRIHPIQYLLVGAALVLFYLLLLSLSEHLPFDTAYLISSISIVLLTTVYTRSISGKKSLALIMGIIITGLYGFLYVLLRIEDYSLLIGSLGLFVILSLVMIFTRKIDWYSFRMGKN